MINASIKSDKDNNINYVFISGHSNYAEAGSDIVCAAVSTALYMSVGLIDKLCSKYTFREKKDSATMQLTIIEPNDLTNIILINLVETLLSIEEDYKKYVKVDLDNKLYFEKIKN